MLKRIRRQNKCPKSNACPYPTLYVKLNSACSRHHHLAGMLRETATSNLCSSANHVMACEKIAFQCTALQVYSHTFLSHGVGLGRWSLGTPPSHLPTFPPPHPLRDILRRRARRIMHHGLRITHHASSTIDNGSYIAPHTHIMRHASAS